MLSRPAASSFGMPFEPRIRQQFGQMLCPFAGDPQEQVPDVGKALQLVRFGAGHHAVENGRGLSAAVAAEEEVV